MVNSWQDNLIMTEPHTLLGARRMISLGMLPVVVPDVGELQLIINVPLLWRFPILTLWTNPFSPNSWIHKHSFTAQLHWIFVGEDDCDNCNGIDPRKRGNRYIPMGIFRNNKVRIYYIHLVPVSSINLKVPLYFTNVILRHIQTFGRVSY